MIDGSLLQDFIAETNEHLEEIEKNLLLLSSGKENAELLNDIFRSIHTIKGSSEYLGMVHIAELSHRMENLLDKMRQKVISPDNKIIDTLIKGTDRITLLMDELSNGGEEKSDIQDLLHEIEIIIDPSIKEKEQKFASEDKSEIVSEINTDKNEAIASISNKIIYEEDYDTELFEIFEEQLYEGLEFLKKIAQKIVDGSTEVGIEEECGKKIKNLQSSANYMGYEELAHFYIRWENILSDKSGIDPGLIMNQIHTIVNMFPKAKKIHELVQTDLTYPNKNINNDEIQLSKKSTAEELDIELSDKELFPVVEPVESTITYNNIESFPVEIDDDLLLEENESELFLAIENETNSKENDQQNNFSPVDDSLINDFILEAGEHLDEIESNLLRLSSGAENTEMLNDIFRAIHTIKGSSEYLGMERIAQLSHRMENLLDRMRNKKIAIDERVIETLITGRDRIVTLTEEIEQYGDEKSDIIDIINNIDILDRSEGHKGNGQFPQNEMAESLPSPKPGEDTNVSQAFSDVQYEEDSDPELFGIFMDQVHEGLSNLKKEVWQLIENPNSETVLKQCLERLESLRTSAHYMGYDRLAEVYEKWSAEFKQEFFSKNISNSTNNDLSEKLLTNIKRIARMFPKSNAFDDLLITKLDREVQSSTKDNEIKTGIDAIDIEIDANEALSADDLNIDLEETAADDVLDLEEAAADDVLDLEETAADDVLDLEETAADDVLDLEETAADSVLDLEDFIYSSTDIKKNINVQELLIDESFTISNENDELVELSEIVAEDLCKDDPEYSKQTRELIEKLEQNFDDNLDVEFDSLKESEPIILSHGLEIIENNENIQQPQLLKDQFVDRKEDALIKDIKTVLPDESLLTENILINLKAAAADESITYPKEIVDSLRSEFDIESVNKNIIFDDVELSSEQIDLFNDSSIKEPTANKSIVEKSSERNVSQSIRVDANKIDILMNQVGELVVNRASFSQLYNDMRTFEHYIKQSLIMDKKDLKQVKDLTYRLSEATQILGRVVNELQESVMRVRMLPIKQLFNRYPRLVHDLVREKDKKVKLDIIGEETELDRMVIEKISDPMVHIIRNSIDHGIESIAERARKGKPEIGTLRLQAYHEGNHVVIMIFDDGKGIDLGLIKAKALEKQLLTRDEAERMSEKELTSLIMLPGFSTASQVTHTSGRGVGMDVVKKNVEKLNGTLEIESKFGLFTQIRIKLPLTLAIIPALLVRVNDDLFTIPLSTVDETIRLYEHELSIIEGVEVFNLRDETIPLLRLTEVFNMESRIRNEKSFVVVVKTGDTRVGLVVDALIGQEEVVIKPLEDYLQENSGFSGATILGDGRISLILDVYNLVNLYKEKNAKKNAKNSVL